ncbi:hypothetical protein [Flavobacterium hibisci]|uniref:hypothetical protein n=1 Tax=Flavobacterium hibisci TaxID=1914462 RepID=UPI001CBB3C8D|nr:hypothetical protein [Flavobacterium hibisci]MBZ4044555.1 hypothetical protein [Flavobacterium hibisci]
MRKKAFFLITMFTVFTSITVSAKVRIPFGKIDKIEIVADLPNNEKYTAAEGSKEYLDLATLHQEYNIAWVIPAWVTQEPKLVLAKKDSDVYYELTDQQLAEIIKDNKLDKDSLLQLGFYTRYGGKAILLIIIGLIIYGLIPGKDDEEETEEVKPTQV